MDAGDGAVAAIEAFEDAGKATRRSSARTSGFLQVAGQDSLTAIAPVYPNFQWRTPILAAKQILDGEEVPQEWVLPQRRSPRTTWTSSSQPDMPPLHYAHVRRRGPARLPRGVAASDRGWTAPSPDRGEHLGLGVAARPTRAWPRWRQRSPGGGSTSSSCRSSTPATGTPAGPPTLLADLGLGATVVAASCRRGRELVAHRRGHRPATQDYLRDCVDVAATVGAPIDRRARVRLGRPHLAMTAEERRGRYAELRENLAPVVDHAAERGRDARASSRSTATRPACSTPSTRRWRHSTRLPAGLRAAARHATT